MSDGHPLFALLIQDAREQATVSRSRHAIEALGIGLVTPLPLTWAKLKAMEAVSRWLHC
jgi:hypothetical protein